MNDQRLTLIRRAHMSTLRAVGTFQDHEVQIYFRHALRHLRNASIHILNGTGGEVAAMENAATHLQNAARILCIEPKPLTKRRHIA